jgi:hypothetical protein
VSDDKQMTTVEDWEMTPKAKQEAERKAFEKIEEERYRDHMKAHTRDKHLITSGDMWGAPWPYEAYAILLCDNSEHDYDHFGEQSWFWIAVRLTADGEAFEIVRIEQDGTIVEHYRGRFEMLDQAILAATTLSRIWNKPVNDYYTIDRSDDRDLTRNLKLNPWGRAVWERKHPDGPVLVVWHLEPLPLYVASWLPFAGSRCVPSLVDFIFEPDPTRVDSAVDLIAEAVFDAGPNNKIVGRAKSISDAYAANGRKGGRPKKKKVGSDP